MRYPTLAALAVALLSAALVGCAGTKGPGADCDDCAGTEANAVGPGAQAAAASASGGQRSNQAPFSGEAGARIDPQTTVGRGSGATTSSSNDMEHRATASGGAQNIALLNPATAQASTGGGGISAAVQEAQKTVASWRSALMLAMTDTPVDMAKLDFIKSSLLHAQADLNAATAAESTNRPNVTNNYTLGGGNTLVGYSRAGNGEDADSPEAMAALRDASARVLPSKDSKPSSAPVVPEAPKPAAGGGN